MKEILKDFLAETGENLEKAGVQLLRFEQDPSDARIIANIFRLLHAIKGTCGFLDLPRLEALAHAAETLTGALREGAPATHDIVSLVLAAIDQIKLILAGIDPSAGEPAGDDSALIGALAAQAARAPADTRAAAGAPPARVSQSGLYHPVTSLPPERRLDTVRVSLRTVDEIMALVSELVATRDQFAEKLRRGDDDTLAQPLARLSSVTRDLQRSALAARLQPVDYLFATLPRLVRDLSAACGKSVLLNVSGGDTELDRQIVGLLRDPLTHLIRNAIDHGFEDEAGRLAAGKPAAGRIDVRARHADGAIAIDISDDGRGLDSARIRGRALELGLASEAELAGADAADICSFIFAPGFTTAGELTVLSGRGIGLDIVRDNLERAGGRVSVRSEPGAGVTFTLKIPLTLSIRPALVFNVAGGQFALPEFSVSELISVGAPGDAKLETRDGLDVLFDRGMRLPVCDLARLFGAAAAPGGLKEPRVVISLRAGAEMFGVIADGVDGVQEIVIKALPDHLAQSTPFNGAAVLGDGEVALLIDPEAVARRLGLDAAGSFKFTPSAPLQAQDKTVRALLFSTGGGRTAALPLSAVQRIETFERAAVELFEGRPVVRYLDHLMPLSGAGDTDRPPEFCEAQGPRITVLIIEQGGRTFGLVVGAIVDIVNVAPDFDVAPAGGAALGGFLHEGEVVSLLDIEDLISAQAVPSPPGAARRRPRVMIIDPSAFFRAMLAPVLQASGCDAAAVAGLAQARALAADSLEQDVFLADLAEIEAAPGGLADFPGAHPCVIGLCAHATPALRQRGLKLGLYDLVGKFDRARLAALVREALGARPERAAP